MKDKNYIIISIGALKAFDKNPAPIHNKNTIQVGNRRSILQHNKGDIQETYYQHHTEWAKTKSFPLRSATRQGCQLSKLLFNIVLEVLATVIKQQKEIKGIKFGKEEAKLSFLLDDIIEYVENPTVSTKKTTQPGN